MSKVSHSHVSGFIPPDLSRLAGAAKRFAVALSGGPDSWALALMAQDQGLNFIALIVDHNLRPESATEARRVANTCAARGIPHKTLTWQHTGIGTRIQERARDARYGLLLDYCITHDIPALMTAHHADDQMETILLRMAKASDVKGLTGLRAVSERRGITLLRPLLTCSKQQLVHYAEAHHVPFFSDPSNSSPHYARARLRAAADVLEAEGLTAMTLGKLAAKMAGADIALDYAVQELVLRYLQQPNVCVRQIEATRINAVPPTLRTRALMDIWRQLTRSERYTPDSDTVAAAADRLTLKQTFGGIVMEPVGNMLRFYREVSAVEDDVTIPAGANAVWDCRFRIVNATAHSVTVTALGNVSTAELEVSAQWAAALRPAAARATLPAVQQGTTKYPVTFNKTVNSAVYAEAL